MDNGTGTALLSYRDLDTILASSTAGLGAASLGAAITLTPAAPGHATVHGPLGITLTVGAAVTNDTLTITSTPAELSALPEPVRTLAATAIGAPLPLPAVPFNVHLTAGTLDAGGLHLTAAAANSVFPTR